MGTEHTPIPPAVPDLGAAYRALSPMVIEMARNAGLAHCDQQEVVQKVGLVLAEKIGELDPEKGTLRMWAAGIARNVLLDLGRSLRVEQRRRDPSTSVHKLATTALTPEEALRAGEALRILGECVGEEERTVFELDALGCTAAEIGDRLGLPVSTVEWKLKEARKTLDRALARLREERAEATRVRGAMWLFAAATDLLRAGPRPWRREGAASDEDSPRQARAGEDRPDPAEVATARRVRRLRVALFATVPALLSLHCVLLPPEEVHLAAIAGKVPVPGGPGPAASTERDVAAPSPQPAAPSPQPAAPSPQPVAPDPTTPSTILDASTPQARNAGPSRPSGGPREAAAPPARPERTFGGRKWMEYRSLVGEWRSRQSPSLDRAPGKRP